MGGLPCRQEVRTTRLRQPGRPAPMRSFALELRVHPRPEPGLFLAPLQPLGLQHLAHPAALHADALLAQISHQAVQGSSTPPVRLFFSKFSKLVSLKSRVRVIQVPSVV